MYQHPSSTNIYFFTATILNWKHVLKSDKCKDIIISSLSFLNQERRIKVFAFVIMPNHIHLVWKIVEPHKKENVQRDFLKYTSQQILFQLKSSSNQIINELEVNAADRKYQVWERNPFSFELYNDETIIQKIKYIHSNPCQPKWNLAEEPEQYKYSSAAFYFNNNPNFDFISHYDSILF